MEAASAFGMLVAPYQTTWRHIPGTLYYDNFQISIQTMTWK